MPICPFATQKVLSGAVGPYTGGPFKIVHHTTEGSSADGAMAAFLAHRSDPHFTVDGAKIYQHIDTAKSARALRNPPGGVQTNTDSAIQIELVGFAGKLKNKAALKNVARLCRWIEAQHAIPRVWPNGPPKPAVNGRDPGGHNRSAVTWDTTAGHYGHSNVPENVHWDPAYTTLEAAYVLAAEFADDGALTNPNDPAVKAYMSFVPPPAAADQEPEVMIDHADVGEDPVDPPI